MMTRHILASDGCKLALHTLRHGIDKSPPIVLLHALAMNAHMWKDAADKLDTDAAVFGLDCRGHGLSDKPHGPYTTTRFAHDVADVLDSLGANRVHVAGCSMGGTIALAFAGRYPQRVASLSVVDSTAWYGEDANSAWEERAQRALNNGLQSLVPFQVERWFSTDFSSVNPTVLARSVEVFLRNDVNAYAESCRMLGQADERAQLSHYRGPAAVIVGRDDYATPIAMSQQIVERLQNATLNILEGMRHYTPIEAPDQIAKIISSAISRGAASYFEKGDIHVD